MSSKKGTTETKQENKLGPEAQQLLSFITPRALEIGARPAWSPEMTQSADAFRNYLQSPAYTQPNTDLVNAGRGMVNTRAAGNPFTQGGMPQMGGMGGMVGQQINPMQAMGGMPNMQSKNQGVTPAQRMQNFAGFGSPESLRNDNNAGFSAPAMMAAMTKPAVDRPQVPSMPSVAQAPQMTQEEFNRMLQARLIAPEYSNQGGG